MLFSAPCEGICKAQGEKLAVGQFKAGCLSGW